MVKKSPRSTLHVPRDSELSEFLDEMSKQHPNTPKWEFLEEILKKLPKTKEMQTFEAYTEFIKKAIDKYPSAENAEDRLYLLWSLIARRILRIKDIDNQEVHLPDSFYDELKKM